MPSITLESENLSTLVNRMDDDIWVVACLCAAWCDVCTQYKPDFDTLAEQHPDKLFLWIDIEDQADVIGDFDVDNFPTLLIQHGDSVVFYGTTLPDSHIANRLITSHAGQTEEQIRAGIRSTAERKTWQLERNLRRTLRSS